jgi:hypothetical protein
MDALFKNVTRSCWPTEDYPAMWTTCALLAALSLSPGQSGELNLTNAHATYGVMGPPRADNKYLPGDNLVLSFDMEGVKLDERGRVLYSIAMEVTDGSGKVIYRQEPRNLDATCSLGGSSVPAYAKLLIGVDQPPGTYGLKVTVTDLASKSSKTLTSSYEVLPRSFGLVRLTTTADPDGRAPAPFFARGQTVSVNFAAVGFGRDRAKGQPDLTVELRVLDADGRPTLSKPMHGVVNKDVPEKAVGVPMQFVLDLNQAGQFSVELKATDNTTGKSATMSFPLTVLKAK